jgi:hypothetical protein
VPFSLCPLRDEFKIAGLGNTLSCATTGGREIGRWR